MVKLKRIYEYWCFESEKDKEDLKKHLGDDLYNDYMKIRDKIPKDQNAYKDFQKLKKLPIDDVQDFVDNFQSKTSKKNQDRREGAKKLYEDSDWVVYRITTPEAAVQYGKSTKWCISGRLHGGDNIDVKSKDAAFWFNHEIEDNNLDGGYYFYLSKKNPFEKYCVCLNKDGVVRSVYNAKDDMIGRSKTEIGINLPDIPKVHFGEDHYDFMSLENAVKNNDLSYVKKILKYDVFVSDSAFLSSIKNDNLEIFKLLVKKIIERGKVGYFNTTDAVKENKTEMVRYLLENGFKIGKYDLHQAVENDKYDIVRLLIDHGADADLENYYGETPFKLSVKYSKDIRIFKLLLKYSSVGSPILYVCKHGSSPENIDMVDILIKSGADIEDRDNDGNTPLCLAAINGDLKLVRFLLNAGANKDVKNHSGKTPRQLTRKKSIKDLLK